MATRKRKPDELTAREETVLLLVRELPLKQQRRLVLTLQALVEANRIARNQMKGKPLRLASDESVRAAFKDVPSPKGKKKKKGRDLGDAMGDFLDD